MVGRKQSPRTRRSTSRPTSPPADVMVLNQEACVASRFIFVEANRDDADRFCERLHARMVEKAAA